MTSQLAIMDDNIEKLRLKGLDLASDAKTGWEQKMSELDVKRESASVKLTEIENSTAEAWSDVGAGAQSAWVELTQAFHEAAKQF
jgi:hypothetical protein